MQYATLEVTNIGITVAKIMKEQESNFLARQNLEEKNSCIESKMIERHKKFYIAHLRL